MMQVVFTQVQYQQLWLPPAHGSLQQVWYQVITLPSTQTIPANGSKWVSTAGCQSYFKLPCDAPRRMWPTV